MDEVIDMASVSLGLAIADMDNVFELALTGYALSLLDSHGAVTYAVTKLNEVAIQTGNY